MKKKISAIFLAAVLTVLQPAPYMVRADHEVETGITVGPEEDNVEDRTENGMETSGQPDERQGGEAATEVTEWKVSDSVTAYYEKGVLTLSGYGAAVPDEAWAGWKEAVRCVVVEEGITGLASYLFAGMQDLEEVTLPKTLESMGSYVFEKCRKLQHLEIPQAIREVPEGAFMECESLKSIKFRGNIDIIGTKAFYGCRMLENAVDFGNAEVIERGADFIRVKDRTAVIGDIPFNGVEIKDEAFCECDNLKAVLYTEETGFNKKAFDLQGNGEEGMLTVYCFEENKAAADEMFSEKTVRVVMIKSPEKETVRNLIEPPLPFSGMTALAAADNTITCPTMMPYNYAKTDSRFAVIRPETFTLNGEYEFCAQVLYSGKAYEKQKYITQVTTFGKWDNKEVNDWAKRIAAGNEQLRKAYSNSGILHTARIADSSMKGKCGAWYRNVGTYQGKIIDAKVTISNYTLYKEGSRQGLGILGLAEDKIGIYAKNISNVILKIDFYEHGSSSKKVNVKGFALLNDIDYGQGIKVESTYDKIYVQTGSTFAVYKNDKMVSPILIDKSGANHTSYYPFALQVEFNADMFGYKYYNDRYFYKDGLANAYIDPAAYTKAGSWDAYWKNKDPYFVGNFNPGYQGFSARRMARTSLPVPAMTVTDEDEKAVQKNQLGSLDEVFYYTVSQNIPKEESAFYYNDFTVKDVLPECLEFISADVEDDMGKNVTSRFLISHEKQNVTFQVKTPASSAFYGVTYHFRIHVRIRRPLDYAAWMNRETGYCNVQNQSVSTLFRGGGSVSKKSNTVETQFKDEIPVSYYSNYQTKKQEQFTEKAYRNFPYMVRDNSDIHFEEDEAAVFAGWDSIPEAFAEKVRFQKSGLPSETKDLTKVPGESKLFAIWDYAPKISRKNVSVFYEGEVVTREMLTDQVLVQDVEDNRQGIVLPLDIRRIRSDDYMFVKEYPEGMRSSDNFRVSFDELNKTEKDDDQAFWVTYHTTDSAGNETNKELKILIRYNEPPEIEAADRTYLLDEVREGILTEEMVLGFAFATDVEDDEANKQGLMMDGKPININDNLSIEGFDSEAFKTAGEVCVTYHVSDRFGKETFHSITVTVIDGGIEALPDTEGEVRFITEKYYGMGQEDGGLHENSWWYTQRDYARQIAEVFSNTKDDTGEWKNLQGHWRFSNHEIARAKQYMKEKGIGNSQTSNGLTGFLTEFPADN